MGERIVIERIPNELLKLACSGSVRLRKSKKELVPTITAGTLLLAMGLSTMELLSGHGPMKVCPTMGELAAAAGIPKTQRGILSRKHRESLRDGLSELKIQGFISFEEDLATWGHKRLIIELNAQHFGGLRKGGGGYSLINRKKFFQTARKSLSAKTKHPCVIPLLCYLTLQQIKITGKYRANMAPKIGMEKLVKKLGFQDKGYSRHIKSIQKAFDFLVAEGALAKMPEEVPALFGDRALLCFGKLPSFFPPSPNQEEEKPKPKKQRATAERSEGPKESYQLAMRKQRECQLEMASSDKPSAG